MKQIKLQKRLPNKLSALGRMALVDLIHTDGAMIKGVEHIIDMDTWHKPFDYGYRRVCRVCYAGAVMAQGGVGPRRNVINSANEFSPDDNRKFNALNSLRAGEVRSAWWHLRGKKNLRQEISDQLSGLDRSITSYGMNKEEFITEMARLVLDLEVAGF